LISPRQQEKNFCSTFGRKDRTALPPSIPLTEGGNLIRTKKKKGEQEDQSAIRWVIEEKEKGLKEKANLQPSSGGSSKKET